MLRRGEERFESLLDSFSDKDEEDTRALKRINRYNNDYNNREYMNEEEEEGWEDDKVITVVNLEPIHPKCAEVLFNVNTCITIMYKLNSIDDMVAMSRCCRDLYRVSGHITELRALRWNRANFPAFRPFDIMEELINEMSPHLRPDFIIFLLKYRHGHWLYSTLRDAGGNLDNESSEKNHVTNGFLKMGRTLIERGDVKTVDAMLETISATVVKDKDSISLSAYRAVYYAILSGAFQGAVNAGLEKSFKSSIDDFVRWYINIEYKANMWQNEVFYTFDDYKTGKPMPRDMRSLLNLFFQTCLAANSKSIITLLASWKQNIYEPIASIGDIVMHKDTAITLLSEVFGYGEEKDGSAYIEWLRQYGLKCIASNNVPELEMQTRETFSSQCMIFFYVYGPDEQILKTPLVEILLSVFDATCPTRVSRHMFTYIWNVVTCKVREEWWTVLDSEDEEHNQTAINLWYRGYGPAYYFTSKIEESLCVWIKKMETITPCDENLHWRCDFIEWMCQNFPIYDSTSCKLHLEATLKRARTACDMWIQSHEARTFRCKRIRAHLKDDPIVTFDDPEARSVAALFQQNYNSYIKNKKTAGPEVKK